MGFLWYITLNLDEKRDEEGGAKQNDKYDKSKTDKGKEIVDKPKAPTGTLHSGQQLSRGLGRYILYEIGRIRSSHSHSGGLEFLPGVLEACGDRRGERWDGLCLRSRIVKGGSVSW